MKSCEPGLHDQSVLNWLFENAWLRLPRIYNIQPPLCVPNSSQCHAKPNPSQSHATLLESALCTTLP
eukprot:588906-Prymnesium_polylepis.1